MVAVVLSAAACGSDDPSTVGHELPPATRPVDRFGWFYKPPADAPCDVGGREVVILTHGDETYRDAEGLEDALVYVMPFALEDPGPNDRPRRNQVARSATEVSSLLEDHPAWFLRGPDGRPLSEDAGEGRRSYLMDPASAEYRRWWSGRVSELVEREDWSGVFLDNVDVGRGRFDRLGVVPVAYRDDEAWVEAVLGFLAAVRDELRVPLWGNLTFAEGRDDDVTAIREHLDGDMDEAFALGYPDQAHSRRTWEASLRRLEEGQLGGRRVLAVAQGAPDDAERRRLAYASYLLAAGDGSSFRYALHPEYDRCEQPPEYRLRLGRPLEGRVLHGSRWVRRFEWGTVVVDTSTWTATITAHAPAPASVDGVLP